MADFIEEIETGIEHIGKEITDDIHVGQKVVAAGIEDIGKKISRARKMGIVRSLASAALSVGGMVALKALIPLVFSVTVPAAAVIAVPIALSALATYAILKSTISFEKMLREDQKDFEAQGFGKAESLLKSLEKNKVEDIAYVASVAIAATGLGADLAGMTDALEMVLAETVDVGVEGSVYLGDKKVEEEIDKEREKHKEAAPKKLHEKLAGATKKHISKPAQAFKKVTGRVKKLITKPAVKPKTKNAPAPK